MKGLDRNAPSVPPQNSPQEAQQVEMWKKYIQWEKSNPLRTEDQTLITKRGESAACNSTDRLTGGSTVPHMALYLKFKHLPLLKLIWVK